MLSVLLNFAQALNWRRMDSLLGQYGDGKTMDHEWSFWDNQHFMKQSGD